MFDILCGDIMAYLAPKFIDCEEGEYIPEFGCRKAWEEAFPCPPSSMVCLLGLSIFKFYGNRIL